MAKRKRRIPRYMTLSDANPYEPPKEGNEPAWSPRVAYLKAVVWAIAVLAFWVACYFAMFIWSFHQAATGH